MKPLFNKGVIAKILLQILKQLKNNVWVIFLAEEGDNVKSSWPLRAGLHACYNGDYKVKQKCKF